MPGVRYRVLGGWLLVVCLAWLAGCSRETTPTQQLVQAAQKGDAAAVAALLKAGANPNTTGKDKMPLLLVALHDGDEDVARVLLEGGADPNKGKDGGALHVAAQDNLMTLLPLLVAKGGDLTARNAAGLTPLQVAAYAGHGSFAHRLMDQGAKADLFTLILLGDLPGIEVLLEEGADLEAKDPKGNTALTLALGRGQLPVVRVLLAAGAQASSAVTGVLGDEAALAKLLAGGNDVNAATPEGTTLLHLAAMMGNLPLMKTLLEKGADVAARDSQGQTPLHAAAAMGKTNAAALLIKQGAQVDATGEGGRTPLHLAVRGGHAVTMQLLVDKKADPFAKDETGLQPLQMAAMGDHLALVESLVILSDDEDLSPSLHVAARRGDLTMSRELLARPDVDVDAYDAAGLTPLHWAAWKNQQAVAVLLQEHGADLSRYSKYGGSPLHAAARAGHKNMCGYLIAFEAPPDDEDPWGKTPLMLAIETKHPEAAAVIGGMGADVNHANAAGITALHVAARYNRHDMAVRLLRQGARLQPYTERGKTPEDFARQAGHGKLADFLKTPDPELIRPEIPPGPEEVAPPEPPGAGGLY